VTVLAAFAVAMALLGSAPVQARVVPRIVVATVPAFGWGDPVLADAAVGALVPATARRGPPCATDFWATLSAGARAIVPSCDAPMVKAPDVQRANASRHYGAVTGTLAERLAERGECVSAQGGAAAVGAADRTGRTTGGGSCRVVLADLTDAVSLPDAVRAARAFGAETVVLVGLPPRDGGAHYGSVVIEGPGWHGLLRGSPRQPGLVTIPDLTALVAGFGGTRPSVTGGSYVANVARLRDLDRRDHLHRRYAGVFFTGLIALPLLLYIWVGVRRRLGRGERAVALVLAAFPASGFVVSLVPWWRAGVPWLAVTAGCVVATFLLAGLGVVVGRRLRSVPVGIAAVCAAVFATDLLTGGYLQETGLASYAMVNGGRFYGLGNTGFAVLATAACVALCAAAARWGRRVWAVAFVPIVALVALPSLGADFGGAVALTAAFGAAVATRARRTAVVLGVAAGLVVAFGVAVLDYARPAADRTHLGRFVGQVLHGGWSDTLARKVDANLHSFTGTWYPLLLAGSLAMAVWLLRRLRDPALVPYVRVLAVLWVVGTLVNDSGVVVAAVGCAVAVPLLLAHVVERS
jgi:hypothetical protein